MYILSQRYWERRIYPTLPQGQYVTLGNFLAEFNRLEFCVFLVLDSLPHQSLKNTVCPTIYACQVGEYLDAYLLVLAQCEK